MAAEPTEALRTANLVHSPRCGRRAGRWGSGSPPGSSAACSGSAAGIIVVPGLVLLLGFSQHQASGTSTATIVAIVGGGRRRVRRRRRGGRAGRRRACSPVPGWGRGWGPATSTVSPSCGCCGASSCCWCSPWRGWRSRDDRHRPRRHRAGRRDVGGVAGHRRRGDLRSRPGAGRRVRATPRRRDFVGGDPAHRHRGHLGPPSPPPGRLADRGSRRPRWDRRRCRRRPIGPVARRHGAPPPLRRPAARRSSFS